MQYITQTSATRCFSGNLHVTGGTQKAYDKFFDIDYHEASNQMIACGYTMNYNSQFQYSPSTTDRRPLIVKYDLDVNLQWIKAYQTNETLRLSANIERCKISKSGNLIAADFWSNDFYFGHDGIIVVNATSGQVHSTWYLQDFQGYLFTDSRANMIVMPNDTTLIWIATRSDQYTIQIVILDLTVLGTQTPARQGVFTNGVSIQAVKSLLLSEDNNYIYFGYVDNWHQSYGVAKLSFITNFTFQWDFETPVNVLEHQYSVKRIFVRNNQTSKEGYIMTCLGQRTLYAQGFKTPIINYFIEKNIHLGGNNLENKKTWMIANGLGTYYEDVCEDVYISTDFSRYFVLIASPDSTEYSYMVELFLSTTISDTLINAQMISNIPNKFGVYMLTGRFFTNDKLYIGGFLSNYNNDFNLKFGIVHTWDWHDYFNPPDVGSNYVYIFDTGYVPYINRNLHRIDYVNPGFEVKAIFTTSTVIDRSDTSYPPNDYLDSMKGPVVFTGLANKTNIKYFINTEPKVLSLKFEHSLTCTSSLSDFSVFFNESITERDFSYFLSYNMTHLIIYKEDYLLLGKFNVIMTVKDYFNYKTYFHFSLELADFNAAQVGTIIPQAPKFAIKPPSLQVNVGRKTQYTLPRILDPQNQGFIFMNITQVIKESRGSIFNSSRMLRTQQFKRLNGLPSFMTATYRNITFNPTQEDMGEYYFYLELESQQGLSSSVFWQVVVAPKL